MTAGSDVRTLPQQVNCSPESLFDDSIDNGQVFQRLERDGLGGAAGVDDFLADLGLPLRVLTEEVNGDSKRARSRVVAKLNVENREVRLVWKSVQERVGASSSVTPTQQREG